MDAHPDPGYSTQTDRASQQGSSRPSMRGEVDPSRSMLVSNGSAFPAFTIFIKSKMCRRPINLSHDRDTDEAAHAEGDGGCHTTCQDHPEPTPRDAFTGHRRQDAAHQD